MQSVMFLIFDYVVIANNVYEVMYCLVTVNLLECLL